jgi:hypothetical protein
MTQISSGPAVKVYVANEDVLSVGTAALSSSGSATLIAGVANKLNDIVSLVITNESSTATVVSLSDGVNTYKFAIAANGGISWNPPVPLPQQAAGNNWTVNNSAAVALDYVALYIQPLS